MCLFGGDCFVEGGGISLCSVIVYGKWMEWMMSIYDYNDYFWWEGLEDFKLVL